MLSGGNVKIENRWHKRGLASFHLKPLFLGGLLLNGGVVEGGVEHHDGEGQHVHSVLCLKLALVGTEVLQHCSGSRTELSLCYNEDFRSPRLDAPWCNATGGSFFCSN